MDSLTTGVWTNTQWAVVAQHRKGGMVVWGPFANEKDAVSFIKNEGHLPEIVGRWDEQYPQGLSVFPFPIYDPATHLQFRREWEDE